MALLIFSSLSPASCLSILCGGGVAEIQLHLGPSHQEGCGCPKSPMGRSPLVLCMSVFHVFIISSRESWLNGELRKGIYIVSSFLTPRSQDDGAF